jgi:hypothetical protein
MQLWPRAERQMPAKAQKTSDLVASHTHIKPRPKGKEYASIAVGDTRAGGWCCRQRPQPSSLAPAGLLCCAPPPRHRGHGTQP